MACEGFWLIIGVNILVLVTTFHYKTERQGSWVSACL